MNLESMMKVMGSEDALFYLNDFRKAEPHQFALIKASGECLDKNLEEIASQLAVLYRSGLTPIVIYGWGNHASAILSQKGIKSPIEDGIRVTSAEAMGVIEQVAAEFGAKLKDAIEAHGGHAFVIGQGDVFLARPYFPSGHPGTNTGCVEHVDLKEIVSVAKNNRMIPIIAPIGSSNGTKYNINADSAAAALTLALEPHKYIALTPTGGIFDGEQNLISEIKLRSDYERLVGEGIVFGGMKLKLDEAKSILDARGEDASVQIIGPQSILKELFSSEGSGTRVRQGYLVEKIPYSEVDTAAFSMLVAKKFGVDLKPSYFEELRQFGDGNIEFYVIKEGESYKGAASVIRPPHAGMIAYMDVIAANGNGMGKDIIEAILGTDNIYAPSGNSLAWRTQSNRNTVPWYQKIAVYTTKFSIDGKDYMGFVKAPDASQLKNMLDFMSKKPLNFVS